MTTLPPWEPPTQEREEATRPQLRDVSAPTHSEPESARELAATERVREGAHAYLGLVAEAQRDDRVLGVVLVGAPGANAIVRPDGHWDVRLVVDASDIEACTRRYVTAPGDVVHACVVPVEHLEVRTESLSRGERYEAVHADVVIDRLDGRIARVVASRATVARGEGARLADRALRAYLDASLRSTTSLRDDLVVEAQLDAIESVSPFLSALFALHERVRPTSRYLRWELEAHPLGGPAWTADRVLTAARVIAGTGALFEQRRLLIDLEALARSRGLGTPFEERRDELAWLHGPPTQPPEAPRTRARRRTSFPRLYVAQPA